jgi:hypothetical protein
MKKVLLSLTAGLLSVTMASAQCTPLAAYADSSFGLWPDSVPFLEAGPLGGQVYQSQIDIKTFVDTTVTAVGQQVVISMDAFKIVSVSGQPAGFTWAAAGPTWVEADQTWYNEGTAPNITPVQGCLSINADAAATSAADTASDLSQYSLYPLVVTVDARIAATSIDLSFIGIGPGSWMSTVPAAVGGGAFTVSSYVLRVSKETGVGELLNTSRFDLGQNYPNPAGDESIVSFTTPSTSNVEFRVYNMLGMLVKSQDILSEKGLNQVKVNTRDLSSGMYVYTMTNGGTTLTKKMTVK